MHEDLTVATGNGQSQCYNCGTISWDCLMYKNAKYSQFNRLCVDCAKKYNLPEFYTAEIKWRGFTPKHREQQNKKGEL